MRRPGSKPVLFFRLRGFQESLARYFKIEKIVWTSTSRSMGTSGDCKKLWKTSKTRFGELWKTKYSNSASVIFFISGCVSKQFDSHQKLTSCANHFPRAHGVVSLPHRDWHRNFVPPCLQTHLPQVLLELAKPKLREAGKLFSGLPSCLRERRILMTSRHEIPVDSMRCPNLQWQLSKFPVGLCQTHLQSEPLKLIRSPKCEVRFLCALTG